MSGPRSVGKGGGRSDTTCERFVIKSIGVATSDRIKSRAPRTLLAPPPPSSCFALFDPLLRPSSLPPSVPTSFPTSFPHSLTPSFPHCFPKLSLFSIFFLYQIFFYLFAYLAFLSLSHSLTQNTQTKQNVPVRQRVCEAHLYMIPLSKRP